MVTIEDLATDIEYLTTCCMGHVMFTGDDIAEILLNGQRTHGTDGYGPIYYGIIDTDCDTFVIVRLKNGKFGLLTASADYTGHGCQCGSMTLVKDTLPEILEHLSDYSYYDSQTERAYATSLLTELGLL